jgi:hypothetical protein
MRSAALILTIGSGIFLLACEDAGAPAEVDPKLGRECFESRRDTFVPGTQYEGIDKLSDTAITIKIMDGANLKTVDCELR